MNNTDINMPVAKAASAITAAAVAKADVADQVVQAVTTASSYDVWVAVNSIPWATVASIAAALYSVLLIAEWFWKKLWRPFLERRGWIKKLRRRIVSVEEYEAGETGPAPL